jgi:predicted Rossmann-fold nucleotide-binding protein
VATSSSPVDPAPGTVEVGVLGSARIDPGDPRHDDARQLGRLLAEQGWTVVTGGYGGLMAATATGPADDSLGAPDP